MPQLLCSCSRGRNRSASSALKVSRAEPWISHTATSDSSVFSDTPLGLTRTKNTHLPAKRSPCAGTEHIARLAAQVLQRRAPIPAVVGCSAPFCTTELPTSTHLLVTQLQRWLSAFGDPLPLPVLLLRHLAARVDCGQCCVVLIRQLRNKPALCSNTTNLVAPPEGCRATAIKESSDVLLLRTAATPQDVSEQELVLAATWWTAECDTSYMIFFSTTVSSRLNVSTSCRTQQQQQEVTTAPQHTTARTVQPPPACTFVITRRCRWSRVILRTLFPALIGLTEETFNTCRALEEVTGDKTRRRVTLLIHYTNGAIGIGDKAETKRTRSLGPRNSKRSV